MVILFLSLAAATPEVVKASDKDNDPIVCQKISRTGSRMPPKKVCKHASQWDMASSGTRRDIAEIQRRAAPESIPAF